MSRYHYTGGLQTNRLTTRLLTEADIPLWATFFKDPEAIEFFPMYQHRPYDECAREWIDRQLHRYASQEYGMQALIEKSTNTLVGQCGLLIKEVDGVRELEVGYSLLKAHWGKGYAVEAARLFIDFAFQHQQSDSVISTISPGNWASRRVAEKNGLTLEKYFHWQGMELCVYRLYM